jgi:pre-mRNA-splicing factor SYF1
VGRLWICLADYYLRQGLFGRSRDVFEEALSSVSTARDFGIVFNAYMKFEEQMIEAEIEEEAEEDSEDEGGVEDQIDKLIAFTFREIPERKEEAKGAGKKE